MAMPSGWLFLTLAISYMGLISEIHSSLPRDRHRRAVCRHLRFPGSKSKVDLGDIVTADYDSYEKAKLDGKALVLVGVFKTNDFEVKYNLRFLQNDDVWKVSSINVDATRTKH